MFDYTTIWTNNQIHNYLVKHPELKKINKGYYADTYNAILNNTVNIAHYAHQLKEYIQKLKNHKDLSDITNYLDSIITNYNALNDHSVKSLKSTINKRSIRETTIEASVSALSSTDMSTLLKLNAKPYEQRHILLSILKLFHIWDTHTVLYIPATLVKNGYLLKIYNSKFSTLNCLRIKKLWTYQVNAIIKLTDLRCDFTKNPITSFKLCRKIHKLVQAYLAKTVSLEVADNQKPLVLTAVQIPVTKQAVPCFIKLNKHWIRPKTVKQNLDKIGIMFNMIRVINV